MNTEFKKRLNVLIIENNPVDNRMLKGMLSKSTYGSFKIQVSETLNQAFQLLFHQKFDVVLLDLNLTDSKGLDTLKKVNKKFPLIPIVVNTGEYEDDVGLRAVTCGAQDYLIKGKYKAYGLSKSLYYAVERKKAEQELRIAYNRLKEAQSQLIQAEKMNVVGGLASGVAHEVKNPLATVIYGVEFLNTKLETQDEQIKLTLTAIKAAANKANEIIKDLLDFASLSKLKKAPEDLNSVIEQALNLIKHHCDKYRIRIIKEFSEDLPNVKIDRNRIEQVMIDVILNSIYAMMKEGGTVIIKTYPKRITNPKDEFLSRLNGTLKVGDSLIVVEVDDTGPGIPEENLPKIFDPFFTTRRAAGGVGLGLCIARTIMSNHHGYILLENIKGGGTRAKLIFKN